MIRIEIVKADTVDDAKKLCPWADTFQRTDDYKVTNNWKCSNSIIPLLNPQYNEERL